MSATAKNTPAIAPTIAPVEDGEPSPGNLDPDPDPDPPDGDVGFGLSPTGSVMLALSTTSVYLNPLSLANTFSFSYCCISANDVSPVPSPRGTK